MTHTTNPTGRLAGRGENTIQVLIMLGVAAMAGAASFRHVHDWTIHNSPAGTGDWFGWANAMVSELIPLAAGLEARRRRRRYGRTGTYPILLICAAVALSLTGQFAEAKPGLSGWLISAVPALGFLALVKLVLSRPTTPATDATATGTGLSTVTPAEESPVVPATVWDTPHIEVPHHLIPSARFAAATHYQATGQPITPEQLATRMDLTQATASTLLDTIGQPDSSRSAPVDHVNGAPVLGEAR